MAMQDVTQSLLSLNAEQIRSILLKSQEKVLCAVVYEDGIFIGGSNLEVEREGKR